MLVQEQEEAFVRLLVDRKILMVEQAEQVWLKAHGGSEHRPVFAILLETGLVPPSVLDPLLAEIANPADRLLEQGDHEAEKREYTKALKTFNQALLAEPDNEAGYWKRARVLFEKRLYAESIADYTKILEMTDRRSEAYNRRGVVLAKLGRYAEAMEDQKAAALADPENPKAHFDSGRCHQAARRFAEAIEAYGRALALKPDYVEAYNNRAITSLAMGKIQEAIADWREALELDEKRTTILFNYKTLLKNLAKKSR